MAITTELLLQFGVFRLVFKSLLQQKENTINI